MSYQVASPQYLTTTPSSTAPLRHLLGLAVGVIGTIAGLAVVGRGLLRYRFEVSRNFGAASFGTVLWLLVGAAMVAAVFLIGRAVSPLATAATAVLLVPLSAVYYVDPFRIYDLMPDEVLGERFVIENLFDSGIVLVVAATAFGATLGALRKAAAPRQVATFAPPPPPPPAG
jgi:hypothetical protein